MLLTLRSAGEKLGVSHVMVLKLIKNGTLVRNRSKKIDTDNPVNSLYFASKGIVFSPTKKKEKAKEPKERVKEPKKSTKKEAKKPKKSLKKEAKENKISEEDEKLDPEFKNDFNNPVVRLEIQTKIATLRVKEADFKLKTLKIEEARGSLIAVELVNELVFDTLSNIIQSYITRPYSYINKLTDLIEENASKEELVKMLASENTKETKKIIESAKAKYERKKKEIIKGLKDLDGEA